ncbi:MAG: hypothetical protein JNM72_14230 [Deltaproteobacteria bacterium]|nr:hypothetical protein [Deltaproteobacteria bacterium]
MAHAPATAPPWELALIPTPEAFATRGDWPALLLVVEARSGAVRLAEPVEGPQGLKAAFTRAIKAPLEGLRPGRPRAVACPQALLAVLQPALSALGLVCHGAHHLPAAHAATMSLLTEFAAAALPARDIGWERVAELMQRPIPWAQLGTELGFRFLSPDPTYNGVLVVGQGPPVSPPALHLFNDVADWRAVCNREGVDRSDLPVVEVRLKEARRPSAEERGLLPHVGVHIDGYDLSVQLILDGSSQVPKVEAQRTLAEACAAVLGLLSAPGGPPAVGAAPVAVPGHAGLRVEALRLRPPAAPRAPATPSLADTVDYATFTVLAVPHDTPDNPDWVVLRARKPDTAALIAALRTAVAVQAQQVYPKGWALTARLATGADLRLGTIALSWMPRSAARGTMTLVVAMGGARVQALGERDPLWTATLPLTILAEDGRRFDEALNDPDPFGHLAGGSWAGPPETWPEPTRVLAAFLWPALQPTTCQVTIRRLVTAGARIWEVYARRAEGGDTWEPFNLVVDDLGPWLTDVLLQRRDRFFSDDVRHITVHGDRLDGAEPVLLTWEPVRSRPGLRPR